MEIVLNSYGVSLRKENECFFVTNQDGVRRIPPDGITTIVVSKSATVTSDAILLAIEKGIDIVFADRGGNVKGRIWSHLYGSISSIRKGQLVFCMSHDAVLWIKDILLQKLSSQINLLNEFNSYHEKSFGNTLNSSITFLKKQRTKQTIVSFKKHIDLYDFFCNV